MALGTWHLALAHWHLYIYTSHQPKLHSILAKAPGYAELQRVVSRGPNLPSEVTSVEGTLRSTGCTGFCLDAEGRPLADGMCNPCRLLPKQQAFRELLQADELLLMAHHLDDQIETVLFRLTRGAGAQGLAGIPAQRKLGCGRLLRPLLQYGRAELAAYAAMHQLAWQEDESNSDQQHDRNYLRHQVLPQIEKRWPDYRQSWRKSLALLSENDDLQKQLGAIDLRDATTGMGGISVAVMQSLGSARQRNLLRCWLQQLGVSDPGWNTLHQFVSEFIPGVSSGSKFALESCDVYRHQAQLFAVQPLPEPGLEAQTLRLNDGAIDFSLNGNGRLRIEASQVEGICPLPHALQVKYREGGESLKLKGRPQKKLKQLLQESGMPPWQRQRVPLLFADAELVCVPGVGIAESYLAQSGQNGAQVVWAAPTQLLAPKP